MLCTVPHLLVFHSGLVSLAVAFFRVQSYRCTGAPGIRFPDANNMTQCPFECTESDTSIRTGSNSGRQKSLVPRIGVTLNTGFMLSTSCCVLAFLSVIRMWNQVVLDNARKLGFMPREGTSILPRRKGEHDQPRGVRGFLDWFSRPPDNFSAGLIDLALHLMELLVYSGAILATIIISEITFWTEEMRDGVEPMVSVGEFFNLAHCYAAQLTISRSMVTNRWCIDLCSGRALLPTRYGGDTGCPAPGPRRSMGYCSSGVLLKRWRLKNVASAASHHLVQMPLTLLNPQSRRWQQTSLVAGAAPRHQNPIARIS